MPLRLRSSPCFCGAYEERARGVLPGSGRGPGRPAWGGIQSWSARESFRRWEIPLGSSLKLRLWLMQTPSYDAQFKRRLTLTSLEGTVLLLPTLTIPIHSIILLLCSTVLQYSYLCFKSDLTRDNRLFRRHSHVPVIT